jgi:hypothetical protein
MEFVCFVYIKKVSRRRTSTLASEIYLYSRLLSETLPCNCSTFSMESLAHDSGRPLVCAEYGYPKGSPNNNR